MFGKGRTCGIPRKPASEPQSAGWQEQTLWNGEDQPILHHLGIIIAKICDIPDYL